MISFIQGEGFFPPSSTTLGPCSSLSRVPKELILKWFEWFSPQEIAQVERVCKRWQGTVKVYWGNEAYTFLQATYIDSVERPPISKITYVSTKLMSMTELGKPEIRVKLGSLYIRLMQKRHDSDCLRAVKYLREGHGDTAQYFNTFFPAVKSTLKRCFWCLISEQTGEIVKPFSYQLKSDRALVLEAVKQNNNLFCCISKEFQDDEEILTAAIQHGGGFNLKFASKRLQKNPHIALAALRSWRDAIIYIHENLLENKRFILDAVKIHDPNGSEGSLLRFVSEKFLDDEEIILVAVMKEGDLLKLASKRCRDNPKIVRAAVNHTGHKLRFASERLQDDEVTVLEAVRNSGWALQFASPRLQARRDIVLEALKSKRQYSVLKKTFKDFRGDRELVLVAVARDGHQLAVASEQLKGDWGVALAATKQTKFALKHVAEKVRGDRNFILAIIKWRKRNGVIDDGFQTNLKKHIPPALLKDPEIISALS